MADITSLPTPVTREEQYLYGIAEAMGESGATDYDTLDNRPQINSITLSGDKTSADLGMYTAAEVDSLLSAKANSADMTAALALKANTADVYTKVQADSTFIKSNSINIANEPTAAEIAAAIVEIWGS